MILYMHTSFFFLRILAFCFCLWVVVGCVFFAVSSSKWCKRKTENKVFVCLFFSGLREL